MPTLGIVDYSLQSGDVFSVRKVEDGGEEKVDCLEERVGRVVEAGEGSTG